MASSARLRRSPPTRREALCPSPRSSGSPGRESTTNPHVPKVPHAPWVVYRRSLRELISLIAERQQGERFKAAGSHWALSEAAISDHTFIETHAPDGRHGAMGQTLTNVVPGCLNSDYLQLMVDSGQEEKWTVVHVDAGKRIYQLYAELDQVAGVDDPATLAGHVNTTFGDRGWASVGLDLEVGTLGD